MDVDAQTLAEEATTPQTQLLTMKCTATSSSSHLHGGPAAGQRAAAVRPHGHRPHLRVPALKPHKEGPARQQSGAQHCAVVARAAAALAVGDCGSAGEGASSVNV
jgi:hypothetical protein